MDLTLPAAPSRRRKFFRVWFPVLAFMFCAAGIVAAWTLGGDDMQTANRRFITFGLVLLFLFLETLWFLTLSPFLWSTRLITTAVVLGAWFGTVKEFQISRYGQFIPGVIFWWDRTDEEIRREVRSGLGQAEGPVDLGGYEFPEYRGRKRDGIVEGPALRRDWKASPPKEVWRLPCGGGYAAFAVAGNLAVTIEQRGPQEAVVAYDTANGKERWAVTHDADFKEAMGGEGPRATPTIADGRVYSLGAKGWLVCLDAVTGAHQWSVEILKDNKNIQWGMSGSPLVYDNLVVVNPGTQSDASKGRAVVAFDRKTGKEVWAAGDTKAGYSSPQLATLCGVRQVLMFDAVCIAGYDATTGTQLWTYEWKTPNDINVAQPIVIDDNRVFISSGYGHGCAMLKLARDSSAWKVEPLWENKAMRCKFTSPVLYQNHLYGIDEGADGILTCVDVETGKRKWHEGRTGPGELLLSGDLLVVLTEDGQLLLVEATPEGYREKGRIQALTGAKAWNLPALANGKLYLRNEREMVCYDLR